MRIVDSLNIRPDEIKPGDVMMCTVTLHVLDGGNGKLLYRMYECRQHYPEVDGVPQGTRIGDEWAVQKQLFPVVGWAGAKPDLR